MSCVLDDQPLFTGEISPKGEITQIVKMESFWGVLGLPEVARSSSPQKGRSLCLVPVGSQKYF